MPSDCDTVLSVPTKTRLAIEPLEVLFRAARDEWPDAILEFEDEACPLDSEAAFIRGTASDEVFIYRDESGKASWDVAGKTDDNNGLMLHALRRGASLTLVWDGSSGGPRRIVETVQAVLSGLAEHG